MGRSVLPTNCEKFNSVKQRDYPISLTPNESVDLIYLCTSTWPQDWPYTFQRGVQGNTNKRQRKRSRKGLKADEDRTEANNWKGQTDLFGGSLLKRYFASPRTSGPDRLQGHIRIDLFIYLYITTYQLSPWNIYSLLYECLRIVSNVPLPQWLIQIMLSYKVWDTYPDEDGLNTYLRASHKIYCNFTQSFSWKIFPKSCAFALEGHAPPPLKVILNLYAIRKLLRNNSELYCLFLAVRYDVGIFVLTLLCKQKKVLTSKNCTILTFFVLF